MFVARTAAGRQAGSQQRTNIIALWWLGLIVMFVLSGFELGIVLQGKQHADVSTQEFVMMSADCALVMLAINALLFSHRY